MRLIPFLILIYSYSSFAFFSEHSLLKLDPKYNVKSFVTQKDNSIICLVESNSETSSENELSILKIDKMGQQIWKKNLGYCAPFIAGEITLTENNAILVFTNSRINETQRESDYRIIKLNGNAEIIWDKKYGGNRNDYATTGVCLNDGNIIVAGYSVSGKSFEKSEMGFGIIADIWILKLSKTGEIIWDKTYGGHGWDEPKKVIVTNENEIVILAQSETNVKSNANIGNKTQLGFGNYDSWLLKLNINGIKIWDKVYGAYNEESPISLIQSEDDGFIIAETTISENANKYGREVLILKIDKNGNQEWGKLFGGDKDDYVLDIVRTSKNEYMFTTSNKENGIYVVNIDLKGNLIWSKPIVDVDTINAKSRKLLQKK